MIETPTVHTASMQKRVVAFVIDDMVVSLFFLFIFSSQLSALFENITVVDNTVLIQINTFISDNVWVMFLIKIIYQTFFVWQNGMTLGKYLMKIKVIDLGQNKTPDLFKALLRALGRVVSEIIFYLGFIFAWFSPLRQTFHDRFSGCVVVDA